jgi:hypothetical protein
MNNPYLEMYKEEYEKAPSYKIIKCFTPMTCRDCKKECNEMFIIFTPDLRIPEVCCAECIDDDWLVRARFLGTIS